VARILAGITSSPASNAALIVTELSVTQSTLQPVSVYAIVKALSDVFQLSEVSGDEVKVDPVQETLT
jgi:hypothetical protein